MSEKVGTFFRILNSEYKVNLSYWIIVVNEVSSCRVASKSQYNREISKQRNENEDGSGNTIKISFGDNKSLGYYDHLKNRKYY